MAINGILDLGFVQVGYMICVCQVATSSLVVTWYRDKLVPWAIWLK